MTGSPLLSSDCATCPVRVRHFEGAVDPSLVAQISSLLARRTYGLGQTLFVEGHTAERVFFIRSGSARLSRSEPDGKELLIDLVGAGGVLGVEALFGAAHATTAVAAEPVLCCSAPARSLLEVLPRHPGLALALIRIMQSEVEELRARMADLAGRSAEERVARFLVKRLSAWLAHTRAFKQSDIAQALGLTPETLCRVLTEFRRRGWVAGQGRQLVVLRPAELDALVFGEAHC